MSGRVYVPDSADPVVEPERQVRGPSALPLVALALVAVTAFAVAAPDPGISPNQIVLRPFAPPSGAWEPLALDGVGTFSDVIEVDGSLVAVGSGLRVDSVPFVWRSTDGHRWQRARGDWEAGDLIIGVEAHSGALFAFGYRLTDPLRGTGTEALPRVWTSQDGREWASVKTRGLPPQAVIGDAAATGNALAAVGWDGPAVLEPRVPPPEDVAVKVWTSPDGIEWTDVTPPDATWFHDVAAFGDEFVLSGTAGGTPTIWRGADRFGATSIDDPRLTAHTVVASVGLDDHLLAMVRLTRDVEGVTSLWGLADDVWTEIDVAGRPDSAGWLRLIDDDLYAGPSFTRSIYPAGPEVWVSDDGDEWIGVEVTGGQTQWPPSIVTAVARFDGALVAFGSRHGRPTVWHLAEG